MKCSTRLSIVTCAVLLSATPGSAQNGHGILHFERDPTDMRITAAVVDPIGAVRDNPTGPIALVCAGTQRESSSLIAIDTDRAQTDRFDSRPGKPALGAAAERDGVARFLAASPQRRTAQSSGVAASAASPNLLSLVW